MSWLPYSYILACLLLSGSAYGVSVAPGDAQEHCLGLSTREAVPDNRKVLLDSQNYIDGSLVSFSGDSGIWRSENFDNQTDPFTKWSDRSQAVECKHIFFACDPMDDADDPPQDNWMITQYINITDDGVDELVIFMRFTTSGGEQSCALCQQSFTVRSYETNVIDETGRSNQSLYSDTGAKFFHTMSNVVQESAIQSLSITAKGTYLAVIDSGSCTNIVRIYVFYYVCPYQVVSMVEYPETVSPPGANPQDRPATGQCIANSSPVGGASLDLECDNGGIWENNDFTCSCNPGYEAIMDVCEPCSEGEYKDTQGNTECLDCPDNSNSTSPGAMKCECFDRYYRTSTEKFNVSCTAPPSAPMGVTADGIGTMFINIKWSPPTSNGGRTDLYYRVTYTNGSHTGPVFNVVNSLSFNITELTPLTQYSISVISVNGVSDQDSDYVNERTVTIMATTDNRGPSKPNGVSISDGILQWSPPDFLYGILMYYNIIFIGTTNNVNLTLTTKNTSFDLSALNVEEGTYNIYVQAVTNNGVGDLSIFVTHSVFSTSSTTTITSESGPIVAVVSGVVGGIVFLLALAILLIVIILAVIYTRNQRKTNNYAVSSHDQQNHINGTNPSSKEMELGILPQSNDRPAANRMYIDPRNYSSLNQAFDETGVKEIPPKEISGLEEIGLGEFGLVYKGKWSIKNAKVAVKTLRGGANEDQKRNFLFEASVMAQFRHENVVKLYGIISRIDPIMIIMEYLDNGSLDRYLQKHLDKLGLKRQLKLAHGVALGMHYLSDIGFVHRDLAARNILVAKDETPKVADFGLAREMVENEYDVQRGGRIPVRWTAPEAISHRSFSVASDVWSFGVLLWEIMTYGETPYEGWDNYAVLDRLENGERLHQPRYCSNDVYQLMLSCWEKERVDRPSFEMIAQRIEIITDGKPRPKPKPEHLKRSPPPEPPSPSTPQVQTVEDFLNTIALTKYLENFHSARLYNVHDLFNLTEDDLERIGVNLAGHQYKIMKNIRVKQEEMGSSF